MKATHTHTSISHWEKQLLQLCSFFYIYIYMHMILQLFRAKEGSDISIQGGIYEKVFEF